MDRGPSAKRRLVVLVIAFAGTALAGCSGNTNPGATKVSDTGATLRAEVRCDSNELCDGHFRWRTHPSGGWVNGPGIGPVKGPVTVNPWTWTTPAVTFATGTTYDYQWCGRGSSSAGYVCVGPTNQQPVSSAGETGDPNTSSTFTTLPSGIRTVSAQQFHDSIGVNVKETYWDTIYGDWSRTLRDVQNIGFSRLRVGIFNSSNAGWNALHWGNLRQAVAAGLKLNVGTSPDCSYRHTPSDAHLSDCFDALRDHVGLTGVESFEWPNEYDISGDPNWASNLASWGHEIFARAKALGPYRVYGPSIVQPANVSVLGDQSSFLDYGNFHDYRGGTSPTPQSVFLEGVRMQPIAGGKPNIATEFGFHNLLSPTAPVSQPGIDEQGAAVYVLRQYLEHLADRIDRSFVHQLYDLGTSGTSSEDRFGLIRADGTYKPAATALKNLLGMVGSGSPSTLTPLSWGTEASDQTADLRYLDIQESDGSHDLVLWRTASVWERDAKRDLTVAPVTIHVNGNFASWQHGDPILGATLVSGSGPIGVGVGANPVVLHIVPSGAGGSTSPRGGASVGGGSSAAPRGDGSAPASRGGGNLGSGPPKVRAACAGLRASTLKRCRARESYHRVLTGCVRLKHGKRTACRTGARTAYHRKLALIVCEAVRNKHKRAGCVRKARKTR